MAVAVSRPVPAAPGTPAGPVGRAGPRPGLRRAAAGWGLAAPFTVLFVLFLAGPVLVSLLISFTDLRSTDLRHPLAVGLVGVDNYARLLSDEQFRTAAANTVIVVAVGLPLTVVLGLAAALGLNAGVTRFKAVFRTGYYLPVNTSIVAVAVVWRSLLQPDSGFVDGLLQLVGLHGPNWLASTTFALPALIVMIAWRGLGFQMVIFLAGLQAIPRELYEAAALDGAGPWARFRYVTLPSLRPTLLFVAVIGSIGLIQVFEEPFVMTRGGPLGATTTVSFQIYQQFGFGNYGYASAMSYALFVVIVALALLWFRLLSTDEVR